MRQRNFTIKQGETLSVAFYWYSGTPVTKAITAITLAYPPVFTAAGHGMPTEEIPVTLSGIRGPLALNTPEGETVYALKATADTFSVASLNASGMPTYVSGGYVRYVPPKDISGYTARMQLRRSLADSTILLDLTSGAGQLLVGTANGLVTLTLTATATAALSFATAVYDLELVSGSGVVDRIAQGKITLSKEVTR
jgi:hypothetical protein